MTFGSLFAGIGGIDLGFERAGLRCAWQIEIDPFCQKVLEKHWPGVPRYSNVRECQGSELGYVDVLAGGFPCQDLSQAGKRAGLSGDRSGLWFEFARLIGEIRPRFVVAENVPGLLTLDGAMGAVVGELARLGYVGCNVCLRASEFGASHLRKRVFIVAGDGVEHAIGTRRQAARLGCDLDAGREPEAGRGIVGTIAEFCGAFAPGPSDPRWPGILRARPDLAPALESPLRRVDDGIPAGLDRAMSDRTKRLKALGNSVVPQCAEWIGRKILEADADPS